MRGLGWIEETIWSMNSTLQALFIGLRCGGVGIRRCEGSTPPTPPAGNSSTGYMCTYNATVRRYYAVILEENDHRLFSANIALHCINRDLIHAPLIVHLG